MSAHEFVRRLKSNAGESDRHYTFWVGAGCSVSSGIPAAAALVKDNWLPRLYGFKNPGVPIEEWAQGSFKDYDPENLGALYGPLMNQLFLLKDDRQRETERLCQAAEPGYGYAILAGLMSRQDGIFSAALTTNFDDLIADSMYSYWNRRPLVIQHDALASFIRPGRVRRPLVVKVHGDHRLSPMHTDVETAELEEGIRKGVQGLLHDRGVIFMGYSGNDRGVIKALKGLPREAIPLGVWWVSKKEPEGAIRDWLIERGATWVQVSGFDEFMLLLQQKFEIPHPTAQRFEEMIERYQAAYERLGTRVEGLPETVPDSEALKDAARSARETAPAWWRVELEARQFRDSDPERADQIYREQVDRLNDARLDSNYALFLSEVLDDQDRAEKFYNRALEADPNRATVLGNYANFLSHVRKDPGRAEEFYKRALAADPEHANNLGNYGLFLSQHGEPDRAEELFERSIEIDPDRANILNAYAYFLNSIRNEYDRAEEFYKRAIEADPKRVSALTDYAHFLGNIRRDPDKAEEFFKRAIDVDPNDAKALGSFARFLKNVRKDPDRAEEFYERAIEVAPKNATNLNNYANFLSRVRNDPDRAETLYKRALESDPNDVNVLSSYANFLSEIHQDPDKAEELYKRAIEVNPNEANALGSFAFFLKNVRKDLEGADKFYERSVEADPEGIDTLGNYANFLTDLGEDLSRAEDLYKRVLEIEPEDANALGNYARLLLIEERDAEAWPLVEKSLALADEDPLLAELWFYILALEDGPRTDSASAELARLIKAGVRSPEWNFDGILARARERDHADIEWLQRLADVISGREDAEILSEWPGWPKS